MPRTLSPLLPTSTKLGCEGWDPATGKKFLTRLEVDTERVLARSAGLLVQSFLPPLDKGISGTAKFRIATEPVRPSDMIQIETEYPGTGGWAIVEASGEVDPDWPETVLANGLVLLGDHFVTRIVEAAEDPRYPRKVEALFVFPDINSADCVPIGRPFVASVSWREGEEGEERIPTLTPTLDGYARELVEEVVASGDPYDIHRRFPGRSPLGGDLEPQPRTPG